ncbi:hypothetical protein CTKA_00510 [Chthonomonas calidirosea]|uniref:ABC-2 family transporter protein n=1 Tax=Chthonomonas calidirosea (strain DSM 23976 / ICMP 18418 / T49) TaxID=1303518 RepID=S0ESV6_CHTCT|nr:hypothetical protein [Chthonomonas calidirosea]CCW34471.1 hypothetical protein CCALI_00645 [Chthonomonas calidirosea T49]CEK14689.1 hypothetical protein CTKA_00510 [Chthonomonas calidirosea]
MSPSRLPHLCHSTLIRMRSVRPPRPQALIAVVKRQWRGKAWWQEAGTAALLFGLLLLIALGLQKLWLETPWQHTSSVGDRWSGWLQQWASAAFVAIALLLPLSGVTLGAYAQPAAVETVDFKASLLTGLTPFELLLGRLFAQLRLPLLCWLCSLLFWSYLQRAFHPLPDVHMLAILKAHVALLSTLFLFASIGCLAAGKASPGRSITRSLIVGYLLFFLLITDLFVFNPVLNTLQNPTDFFVALLFMNPVVAVTTPIKFDLLRTQWVYDHTSAPDYPFQYPSWLHQGLVFFGITLLLLLIAQKRCAKAYFS